MSALACPCGKTEHPGLAGTTWRLGAAPRTCWLYENDAYYRAHWGTLPGAPAAARAPLARWLARLRTPDDTGLGDTLRRWIDRGGGKTLRWAYEKITGRKCSCPDHQAALNALYPYPPPEGHWATSVRTSPGARLQPLRSTHVEVLPRAEVQVYQKERP